MCGRLEEGKQKGSFCFFLKQYKATLWKGHGVVFETFQHTAGECEFGCHAVVDDYEGWGDMIRFVH